jgi:hypothetical protein
VIKTTGASIANSLEGKFVGQSKSDRVKYVRPYYTSQAISLALGKINSTQAADQTRNAGY